MATKNKIIEMIGIIKTIYPYYAKEIKPSALVNTWHLALNDIDDTMLNKAFTRCLQVCTMPPTPADICKQIATLVKSKSLSANELWGILDKTLGEVANQVDRFNYTFVEENGKTQGQNAKAYVVKIWNELDNTIKGYLGSQGELIRISQYTDDELKFEKTKFFKYIDSLYQNADINQLQAICIDNFKLNAPGISDTSTVKY